MAVRFSASGQNYTRTLTLSTQTALTVCGWFKISVDRNTYSSIFFIDNGTSDNWGMQTGADGTTMASVFDASTQQGIGSMTVGTWYFICLSTSGTTGNIFYRTAAQSTLTTVAVTSVTANVNAATLRIGESPWGSEWLNGCAAAIKGWNAALTAAEAHQESMQYVPHRFTNQLLFHPFVKAETTDYSGNARTLSGGSGTATEDGPPIPWRAASPRLIHIVSAGGAVTLAGISSASSGVTGAASMDRPITGVGAAASGASGALSVARPVDATASAASGATPGLGAGREVAASAAAAGSASADQILRAVSVSAAASGASGFTGASDAARPVGGHVDAADFAAGSGSVDRPIAGVSAAASGATGDLTKQGQTSLDGSASASSSASGSMVLTLTLTAVSSAAAGATGDLSKQGLTDLAGATPAASGATGSMVVGKALAAVGASSDYAAGDLSTHGPTLLAGAAGTASGASGALSLALTLTSVIPASAGATGLLARARPLTAVASAASGVAAALQVVGAVTYGQMAGVDRPTTRMTSTDRDTTTMRSADRGVAKMTGG